MNKWMSLQADDNYVPPGHFNTLKALRQGQLALYEKHHEVEAARLHTTRGGSAGAIIDGDNYGECARKAHLRYHGVDVPLDEEIELMTRQGEGNEDIFLTELAAAGYRTMTQGDAGLQLRLFGEVDFIGSPDVCILLGDDEVPVVGLELKNISSVSKAKSVHYELKPDTKHMIQAATYAVRMGEKLGLDAPLPYQLIYSSRSVWHMFSAPKNVKKAVEDHPWDTKSSFGKLSTIQPFHRVYYLEWEDGMLRYWTSGMAQWQHTKLNKEALDEHVMLVAKGIEEQGHLPPPPTLLNLDGSKGYSPCNYCDFSEVCESHSEDYSSWMDHARIVSLAAHNKRANIGE